MEKERTEYNLTKLKDLTGDDREAIKHFTRLFIDHTIGMDLPLLKGSVHEGNWQEASQIAHRMKASIDLFGIDKASKAIRFIEHNGKAEQRIEDLQKEVEALDEYLNNLRAPLTSLLQE